MNFADGRGNVTGVAEVNKSDGLVGTARRNVANDLGFDAPLTPGPFTTVLTPQWLGSRASVPRAFRWWTMSSSHPRSGSRPRCSA